MKLLTKNEKQLHKKFICGVRFEDNCNIQNIIFKTEVEIHENFLEIHKINTLIFLKKDIFSSPIHLQSMIHKFS